MQEYEVVILYKPLLLEDIKKSTISKIEKLVEKNGGEFKEVENLGKKLLAYKIKNFDEGHYIEYKLVYTPSKLASLEKQLKLMDNILRFLVIKK